MVQEHELIELWFKPEEEQEDWIEKVCDDLLYSNGIVWPNDYMPIWFIRKQLPRLLKKYLQSNQ